VQRDALYFVRLFSHKVRGGRRSGVFSGAILLGMADYTLSRYLDWCFELPGELTTASCG
jgi:hypothetical protein